MERGEWGRWVEKGGESKKRWIENGKGLMEKKRSREGGWKEEQVKERRGR